MTSMLWTLWSKICLRFTSCKQMLGHKTFDRFNILFVFYSWVSQSSKFFAIRHLIVGGLKKDKRFSRQRSFAQDKRILWEVLRFLKRICFLKLNVGTQLVVGNYKKNDKKVLIRVWLSLNNLFLFLLIPEYPLSLTKSEPLYIVEFAIFVSPARLLVWGLN